jgi:hypothetical protein
MRVELQMDLALYQRAVKAETEAALLRAALDAETARWEEAMRLTWQMVDPFKPAGTPGSYARGQDSGIVAALTTLRANLKTPNEKLSGCEAVRSNDS